MCTKVYEADSRGPRALFCHKACKTTVSSRATPNMEEHDPYSKRRLLRAAAAPPPALIALTMLPEGHGGKSTPDELLAGKWQGGLVCHEHVPTRSNHRQMFVGHGHSDGPHDHHPYYIFTPPPSRHKSPERGPRSWRRLPQGHRQPLLGHTPVGVWHARWSRVRF